MSEWGMAKIMSRGRRLDYNMIKTSKIMKLIPILTAE